MCIRDRIKGPELISKWVGDSEKAVRELFKKAKQSSPSIIFLDEFESIAGVRRSNTGEGSDVMNRVVNQLLSSMDGVESMEGVIVVAATNRPEMIDPALLRSGRFERVLHIPPPDVDSIKAILRIHSEPMPLGRFNIEDLAPQLVNYTGADIEAICREAALISMRAEKKSVSKKHFEEAINSAPEIYGWEYKKFRKLKPNNFNIYFDLTNTLITTIFSISFTKFI